MSSCVVGSSRLATGAGAASPTRPYSPPRIINFIVFVTVIKSFVNRFVLSTCCSEVWVKFIQFINLGVKIICVQVA